jgi:hypothetical protein
MPSEISKARFEEMGSFAKGYQLSIMPVSESNSSLSIGEEVSTAPRGEFLFFVADPVSWSVIMYNALTAVGKVLLAAVVNAFVEKISGENIDLERLIQHILMEFGQVVRQILREEDLRKCGADTEAIIDLMKTYVGNPASNKSLLPGMTIEAAKNVSQLKSLGVPATGAFSIAAIMELVILLELHSLSRTDGDWSTCQRKTQQFKQHITDLDDELEKQTASRFSALITIASSSIPGLRSYTYTFDGQATSTYGFPERSMAETARANHIISLTRDLKAKIIAPAAALANKAEDMIANRPA